MFSLVEVKNRKEDKKVVKLIETCNIKNKHSKKCYIKLSKAKKCAVTLLCSSDDKHVLIDIQRKLIAESPKILLKKEVEFAPKKNKKSVCTSSEKCNITPDMPHQNSSSERILNINNDMDSCLENSVATPVKYYTNNNADVILNSILEKSDTSTDMSGHNNIQNCVLEAKTLQSDPLLNSKIDTDINKNKIYTAQINETEQRQKKPKIIKNEICKIKINILKDNLNLLNDDLPDTSILERSLDSSMDSTNLPIKEESIFSSTLATKPSVASVTNDISVITRCDENETNDNDMEDDYDSDFVPSIQSEESNDISENDEQFDKSENNSSSQNKSASNCLNESTFELSKTQSKRSLKGDFVTRQRINYCKDDDLFVEMSRGPKGDKKSNFCMYCNKMQTKIARHLELKHSNEEEVAKFLLLPKGSYERRTMISHCRKKGNYKFNTHSDINKGFMIVTRRPNNRAKQNGSNFLPCPKCGGHYARTNLRHHFRFCSKKKDTSRHILQLARSVSKSVHNRACTKLRTRIIPIIRKDDIRNIIRYDLLIILFGNHLCHKHRLDHQDDYIRAQLRLLGRYLQALKQIEPQIQELQILFDPKYYDIAVKAVNVIAKYNEETDMYDVPFNALSIGTMLKKMCKILINECIKQHDNKKQKLVENFQKILHEDYGDVVNKTVGETLSKRSRQKEVKLPLASDIAKFNKYLEEQRTSNMEILQNQFSLNAWRSLLETTLIIIQVFNRRRAGEIERTLIDDYKNSMKVTDADGDYKKLPASEKEIAKKYVRFTVRGKLNRTVPVLLNPQMVESIETILKYRKIAGVSFKNPYLFGIPSNSKTKFKYVRACKLMREYSATCGAENVSTLRGTILRKHIATKCLSLNLTETEVSHVANFMGHHQDIHKQIYRQPVAKVDILDMSKILEKAGNVSAHNTTNSSVTRENITDITDTSTINLTSEIQEMGCISTDSNKNEIIQISKEESENEILENEDSEDDISLPFADTSNENISKRKKAKKRKYSGDVLSKSNKHKKKTRFTQPCEKIVRKRWTVEEKKIALSLFEENINKHIVPSLIEITIKIRKTILKDRSPAAVYTWLHNLIREKKKKEKKAKEEEKHMNKQK